MKMWWHYPNFVETNERTMVKFTSMEEFYAIPRIIELAQGEGFSRWSISDDCLMMECNDESFWVIAHRLDRPAKRLLGMHLPKWVMPGMHLPKWVMPVNKEAELINRQLPYRVLDLQTLEKGKYIVEARAVGDLLEYRYFGETDWSPKPPNSGLSHERLGKLEQEAEDAAAKKARQESDSASSSRLEAQRQLMKLSLPNRTDLGG
jgi:hypothetical protein